MDANLLSIYVWAVAAGVIGIICVIVSVELSRQGKSGSAELRFAGLTCACLAVIFATCTYFVSHAVISPTHIEHTDH